MWRTSFEFTCGRSSQTITKKDDERPRQKCWRLSRLVLTFYSYKELQVEVGPHCVVDSMECCRPQVNFQFAREPQDVAGSRRAYTFLHLAGLPGDAEQRLPSVVCAGAHDAAEAEAMCMTCRLPPIGTI